jgi:hypothetical protein
LFDRPDFKAWAGGYSESARWLLGCDSARHFCALAGQDGNAELASRALPHSGYYLLQCGRMGRAISVVFDCGELGLGPLAGHGHADAMSFTLRVYGADVLVDPGAYDYFSYPKWREYFRSTRAHNTVVIDDLDQSVIRGPFLWGRRANARCLSWQPSDHGGKVAGEHNGYVLLRDPVVHRRTLELNGQRKTLTVRDDVDLAARHHVAVYFHLAEECRVKRIGPGRFSIDFGPGVLTFTMDDRLTVATFTGSEDPIAGWVSRGYHRKAAGTTLVGRCVVDSATSLVCRVEFAS